MNEDQELVQLGNRIRDRREHLHMSQDDLVRLTGIEKSTIHRLEYGKNEMRVLNLKKIAAALHCTTDYLLYGEQEDKNDPDIADLLRTLSGMSPAARNICISQVQHLAEQLPTLILK